MKLLKNNRGDTIVEVLLAVAILALVLTSAFVLANRSSKANQQALERAEAYKLAQSEIELLKSSLLGIDESDLPQPGTYFCFLDDGSIYKFPNGPSADDNRTLTGPFYEQFGATKPAEDCKGGVGGFFNTYVYRGDNTGASDLSDTFTAYTRWPAVTGNGVDQAAIVHRIHPDNVNTFFSSPGPTPTNVSGPPPNSTPAPIDATISPTTRNYPSWHMLTDAGVKSTQVFTISASTSLGAIQLTTASISGTNANSFQITSNTCLNRQLTSGQTCTVTVQFFPPSGAANNRANNAGVKRATLTVNNSSSRPPQTATLTGRAVTDRMLPGDLLPINESLRSYSPDCYNNADTCKGALLLQGDTNLVLYFNGTYRWCTCHGAQPAGSSAFLAMQPDGHLVLYRSDYAVLWASYLHVGGAFRTGDYLVLHDTSFYPPPYNVFDHLLNMYHANNNPYYNFSPVGAFYP